MSFRAAVDDIQVSMEVAGSGALVERHFPQADQATVAAILESAGQFAEDVLAPLNRVGDQHGATLDGGQVRVAPGFAAAYRQYVEGGWASLSAPAPYGGMALPRCVALAVFEIVHAANMAFGLCPMLSLGAVEALLAHGSARQQRRYLPKLVSGEWTGTMNLTESDAGSDLALIKTTARPEGDHFRLSGQKIFITWGDHDASDNIVHLVLARLTGAPAGVGGLSLFLVPKRLVNEDDTLGENNAVRPLRIEHKLGIHGSPTCAMLYDDAYAELIGEPHRGLACMFTMMNSARLNVGMEGVGIAERAFQQALEYARERRQGRSPWSSAAVACLFDQPDVRRTLLSMKAKIAAARGICFMTAIAADEAAHAAEAANRARAKRREEWLTPIAKAWSTDVGVEVCSAALQVHGGAGYIEATGVAQHYRDARIAPIYEGTNGIQAMDLAGRKLSLDGGAATREILDDMTTCAERCDAELAPLGAALRAAVETLGTAARYLAERRGRADALLGASVFLTLAGDVVGGWVHARTALAARTNAAPAAAASAAAASADAQRVRLALYYAEQILSRVPGYLPSIMGDARLVEGWS